MTTATPEIHERFHLDTLDDLRAKLAALGIELPISEDLSVLADTVDLGPVAAWNRFVVHPMEGFDSLPDGAPSPLSFRRYQRFASGGAALIWFEATAILWHARSNPGQLWLHGGNVGDFRRIVEETKRAGLEATGHEPIMVVQLTHSGRYSKPEGVPAPIIAQHSGILDPVYNLPEDYPLVTDDYLDELQDTYVNAAKLAAEAGFDGVDIKACHGYLLAELLAARTREGKYGGPYENRTRMLREVMGRVATEVEGVFPTTRLNVYDGYDRLWGWGVDAEDPTVPDLEEPGRLIGELRDLGAPVINVTLGNPYFNPHLGRPYDHPVSGGHPPAEHPLEGVRRFVDVTRELQLAHPEFPLIATGYTWLRHLLPYVAAGAIERGWATMIGQGRGSLAYPDSVLDLLREGAMDPEKCCVTCSACTQIMRDGARVGCVVRDSELYGPEYRRGRRFATDSLRAQAMRCRDCHLPTCTAGCPARVEVPRFLAAFAEGDIPRAYRILRENNALPEMCGYVCPSEVQCEGGCIETVFCEDPVHIRDIQLATCRTARQLGITGVDLPDGPPGGRVAVVGAGPAGLAAAIRLLELGHHVTLYDAMDRLGGTPVDTIPPARYGSADAEVQAILAPAMETGHLETVKARVFTDEMPLEELRASHDAVVVALGLVSGFSLGEMPGVMDAMEFLARFKSGQLPELPPRVAVLGGGNTAVDAAVSAVDAGARDVYVVYRRSMQEMPAWPEERQRLLDSGAHLLFLTQPLEYVAGPDGALAGIRVARTELGEPDESGRRSPQVIEGSEYFMGIDLAIEAMGMGLPKELRGGASGIKLTDRGFVWTGPDSLQTSIDGVYAAGDMVNGGTTAVQAVAEGMAAAEEVHERLVAAVAQ
jgi:NADPH-dependent glutamate synthase beta subunit-like oxidoreductase/2,4-dienoyl-CoA reductase-like NADH-dependent reductase (Old Yellow Enzyme family)